MFTWKTILSFVLSRWRGASIIVLSGVIALGYNHYSKKIEILELKLENAELQESRCKENLENQNKRIEDAAESTKNNVEQSMKKLDDILSTISKKEKDQIADILDEAVPLAEDCQGARDYLIDAANKLRWNN